MYYGYEVLYSTHHCSLQSNCIIYGAKRIDALQRSSLTQRGSCRTLPIPSTLPSAVPIERNTTLIDLELETLAVPNRGTCSFGGMPQLPVISVSIMNIAFQDNSEPLTMPYQKHPGTSNHTHFDSPPQTCP